jgi:pantoate--beta-alanine ligase
MKIIKRIEDLKHYRQSIEGMSVGFVPTMGYLHDGHLSLVDRSLEENQVTVTSIFVNPTQFAPGEDLDRYPRNFDRDRRLLEERSADCLFFPDNREMYGDKYDTFVEVERLGKVLCGKTRPTHFRGVATVVLKLFNLVRPTVAYFGQKDAQQAIILKRMAIDLNLDVSIRVLPTLRDPDGLALSSRNRYLSEKEREASLLLSRALNSARDRIREGRRNTSEMKSLMRSILNGNTLVNIDYIEMVSLDNLEPLVEVDPENTLAAVAVKVGQTRLIDNFILGEI